MVYYHVNLKHILFGILNAEIGILVLWNGPLAGFHENINFALDLIIFLIDS